MSWIRANYLIRATLIRMGHLHSRTRRFFLLYYYYYYNKSNSWHCRSKRQAGDGHQSSSCISFSLQIAPQIGRIKYSLANIEQSRPAHHAKHKHKLDAVVTYIPMITTRVVMFNNIFQLQAISI
jgi:hypothetical protein